MLWWLVAIGGALGAVGRFTLIQLFPLSDGQFPWAIWLANVLGSLIIGFLYVLIVEKNLVDPLWRPFLMVGFLGALTTFSTFALDAVLLWQQGQVSTALAYVLSSIAACIAAVLIAMTLAQRLLP